MTSPDADRIVSKVLEGNLEAYGELVRRYQTGVWKVVAALLQDPRATEELVQKAFVEAYLHLDRYQPGADFEAWIKAIARNHVRLELQVRSRESHRLAAFREFLARRLDDSPAVLRRQELLADALRKCRERLPESGAQALELRYERCLSFEEVSGLLGRTLEATRQLLSRTRLALRDCIERRMAQA